MPLRQHYFPSLLILPFSFIFHLLLSFSPSLQPSPASLASPLLLQPFPTSSSLFKFGQVPRVVGFGIRSPNGLLLDSIDVKVPLFYLLFVLYAVVCIYSCLIVIFENLYHVDLCVRNFRTRNHHFIVFIKIFIYFLM